MTYPKLSVTGGPHGKNTEVRINDELVPGVHRLELTFDAHEVVQAKIFQFAEATVETELPVVGITKQVRVRVHRVRIVEADGVFTRAFEPAVEGIADDLPSALRAAADAFDRLPKEPIDVH